MARKPALCRVEWLDAMHAAEDSDEPGVMQSSVGFVVKRDRGCVKLAQSITHYTEGDEFAEVLTIPRAYVRAIVELRPKPAPARKPKPEPKLEEAQ